MPESLTLRIATEGDQRAISTLITFEYYVHRHLDWRSPTDWLGRQPFWLLERNQRLLAALACPPDPPEVAWVRFFAASTAIDLREAWQMLFEKGHESLPPEYAYPIAGLALQDWFAQLLIETGFRHRQHIVVLQWNDRSPQKQVANSHVSLRTLKPADLPAVQVVDELAFERLWQISLDTLTRSYKQSAYSMVAEIDGKIVGYQISTQSSYSAHLARLAVDPSLQQQGIGALLVRDLQAHFSQRRSRLVTVNTQSDNHASLALYEKLGFERTGERFPVFVLS